MIRVVVRRDPEGEIRSLRCSGHAAFNIEGGVDIVCAGVSALMGALVLGLTKVVGIDIPAEDGDGLLGVSIPPDITAEQKRSAQVLLETAVLSLAELAQNYKGFVIVE